MTEQKTIVVIGNGLAGRSTAEALVKCKEVSVVVIESRALVTQDHNHRQSRNTMISNRGLCTYPDISAHTNSQGGRRPHTTNLSNLHQGTETPQQTARHFTFPLLY